MLIKGRSFCHIVRTVLHEKLNDSDKVQNKDR